MKKLLKYCVLLIVALCAFSALAASPPKGSTTPTAAATLKSATDALKAAKSLTVEFKATGGNSSISGTLLLSGKKFVVTTPEISTWFDGKTQWAFSPQINEVNISEPTTEELAQINPFAIMETLRTNFNARRLSAPAGSEKLELTPKANSDFKKIILTLDAKTHYPKNIEFTTRDNMVTSVAVNSITKGASLPADKFRFNARLYPGIEVIDLR